METQATAERIIVGVDGSEGSRRAVRWALEEARLWRLPLDVVFAWEIPALAYSAPGFAPPPPAQLRGEGLRVIEEILSGMPRDGVEVSPHVYDGAPTTVLRELGEAPGVPLVVVGSRGRGGVAELLLGSVSHYLTHHCAVPLVVVPARPGADAPAGRRDRITVGMDGSAGADQALRWAAAEARRRKAVLDVVGAWTTADTAWPVETETSVPVTDQVARSMSEMVDRRLAQLSDPGLVAESAVVEGNPADVLVARAGESDLLVVGSRGLSRTRELLLGSVSHACVHRSPVPVAIVRATGTAGPAGPAER